MSNYFIRKIFWSKISILTGVLFFVLWVLPAFAQVDTAWVRDYNGLGNSVDGANAVAVDGSSDVYMTGRSAGSAIYEDYTTIKNWACTPGSFGGDTIVNLGDILYLIAYFFHCGLPPTCQPVEANGNCELDFGDLIYVINYLFRLGPAPVAWCSNSDTYTDPGNRDTIRIGTVCDSAGMTVDVPVYVYNDEAVYLVTPLRIDTTYVKCDSVVTTGTRGAGIIEGFPKYCKDYTGILLFPLDDDYFLLTDPLPAGSGIVAYLRCTIKNGAPPGFVEIDSTFLDPNKLRFFKDDSTVFSIKPVFISGGINIPCGAVLDCSKSYTDSCLTFCPLGDVDFKVTLRSTTNNPVVGYDSVWLDFTDCAGQVFPCSSFHPQWPKVLPLGPSDDSGRVYFRVHAGGYSDNSVKVMAGCGQISELFSPRSVDLSGNLLVEPFDYDASHGEKRDFNCDDTVNWRDDDIFKHHKNHGCYFSPCLFLHQTIALDPDTTLVPGDSIDVEWRLENLNSFDTCYIEKIEFYYTNFSGSAGLTKFHTEHWNSNLFPRGNIQLTIHNFMTPNLPNMCVIARVYTDCCTLYAEAKNCWDIRRLCPPDAMTYRFSIFNVLTPLEIDTTFVGPVATGEWSYSILWNMPDSVIAEITTDDESPMGTKGGVTLWFKYDDVWEDKNFEVIFTLNSGDVNTNCKVNLEDPITLANYILKGIGTLKSKQAADVNCDCSVNLADVVYLANYIVKGGPSPVPSDSCSCKY